MRLNSLFSKERIRRAPRQILVSLCILAGTVLPAKADSTVFQQIIDNVTKRELSTASLISAVTSARNYMQSIGANGAWADIDYASTAQTNWPAIAHLDRLKAMAIAYVAPESELRGDTALYTHIVNALNFWYTKKPTSTNWFNWEIGWPQRMGVILCLLRSGETQVPATTESNILNWQKSISKGPNQSGSQGTGANKMDIALQWIYRTALQKDKTNLDFAVTQFFLPIKFNTGEGLQCDYSYLQHGPQLYTGGYGGSVLTATIKVAYYLAGTTYAAQGDYLDYISRFVRIGYLPSVRGQYMSYNNVGRSLARKNGTKQSGFATITSSLEELDPINAETFAQATQRLWGEAEPAHGLQAFHRHYWRSDYTVHQRSAYTMDVRTASTRTYRCENGNGENLKGYFMTEGGTWIAQTGKEYEEIFPVWDWAHLPGTTVPAVTTIPQPAQWGQYGQSTFTEGVSDGLYGAMTYRMNNTEYSINTQANKSWFFFDNEVVCMGAGIQSANTKEVHTTVNQCLLTGEVTAETLDGTPSTLEQGEHKTTSITWLNHDKISYYFPEGGKLGVRNASQSGTWKSISTAISDATTVKKDVFKMWLSHGIKPTGGSYVYCIVPNTESIAKAKQTIDSLVMVNTDSVQAVYNHTLQMVQAVFYKPATLTFDSIEVKATAPCALMLTDVNRPEVKVCVSDPSYALDALTIYAKVPALGYKQLDCSLNRTATYEGSTSRYVIDAQTPDSVYIPVQSIHLSAESLTLGKAAPYARLTAQTTPAKPTNAALTWSSTNENVVRVDSEGRILALRSGTADVVVTSADGASATCPVTVENGLATAFTTADAYVYDGAGTTNYGTNATLVVRNDGTGYRRGTYARFPLAALDSVQTTGSDARVKLVFHVTYGAEKVSEVQWNVFSVAAQWNENTVTWSNGPSYATPALAAVPCFVPKTDWTDNYVAFDVTSYALAQHAAGATDLSVYIYQNARATGGKGTSQFASRENGSIILSPRLVVEGEELPVGIHTATADADADVHAFWQGDVLTLTAATSAHAVLYDMYGHALQSWQIPAAGTHTYTFAAMPKGIYLLRVGNRTLKLVK